MECSTDVWLAIDLLMPGGALAVAHGDEVVPLVNCLVTGMNPAGRVNW